MDPEPARPLAVVTPSRTEAVRAAWPSDSKWGLFAEVRARGTGAWGPLPWAESSLPLAGPEIPDARVSARILPIPAKQEIRRPWISLSRPSRRGFKWPEAFCLLVAESRDSSQGKAMERCYLIGVLIDLQVQVELHLSPGLRCGLSVEPRLRALLASQSGRARTHQYRLRSHFHLVSAV